MKKTNFDHIRLQCPHRDLHCNWFHGSQCSLGKQMTANHPRHFKEDANNYNKIYTIN